MHMCACFCVLAIIILVLPNMVVFGAVILLREECACLLFAGIFSVSGLRVKVSPGDGVRM